MKSTKNKFNGTAFVGIDVHKNSWKVCLISEGGFKKEFSCNPETQVLISSLLKLLPEFQFKCTYEAGFSGFWLCDQLNSHEAFECIVVNPADIPTSNKDKSQKEDRRDARKIATQLKADALRGIYVPCEEDLGLREIQRIRYTITSDLTRWKNRTKSFLFRHGITPPTDLFPCSRSHWTGKFIKWLKSIEFKEPSLRFSLDQLIVSVEILRDKKKEILSELQLKIEESKFKDSYLKLIEIPGIGTIGSATIMTEVIDIKRFSSYEKFHSFIGLIPSTNSSAETERVRGITNRANKRLRSILVEASWVAIRHDTDLFNLYHQLKQRMNTNKAIVRVAKKLATRIRYELLTLEMKTT
ncbi:MAG: IS110 family transposase [Flavobacteriales bacterium]|nr:IS110 family transposase [Flavobacteriales bacterium]